MSKATARSVTLGLVGLLLLVAWGHAEAQLPAASAEVARVAGQVSVLAKGTQNWTPATVGARLVEGDQIRALARSSADLNLPDGSTILVAENTRFAVTKLEYDAQTRDRNASFYLVAGKVRAQVSQAAVQLARQRQSNFTISTPSGVAAVRGTIPTMGHHAITNETVLFVEPRAGQSEAAARVTYVPRVPPGQTARPVTLTGGSFIRHVRFQPVGPVLRISTLPQPAQAAIGSTDNAVPLPPQIQTDTTLTIVPATTDTTTLQQSGAAVVTTTETTTETAATTTGGTTTTTISTVGQDTLSNSSAPPCTPSSSTTCP